MGGVLTLPNFLSFFPSINPSAEGLTPAEQSTRSTNQGIAVASYNLGCFFGAILTIFIGNPLGRKRMIMLGTSIMIIGAILQASATTLPHFILGRIITGLGNGGNTSTVPTWQSEASRAHKRGKLVMVEGALITGGIMTSYWVDLGMSFTAPSSVSWRFPLAFQIVFCVFILAFIWGLPESPRWLILKGREDEARVVLAALADREVEDKEVRNEFIEIKDTVVEMSKGTFGDLFTMDKDRNLHRTLLAYINQMFQQISGINLITYYAAVIYKGLGMTDFMSRLLAALNGTEYFIASWPAVFLVERVGRRKLMLFGAVGQAATMAILAGVNSRSETGFQIAGIVFLFVFNTFFAVGWLGMTWLYPAEIVSLRTRAPANALSTSANWIFNFLVVMITPVAFNSIGYQTYIIFAVINAFMVPSVYWFYPETAYRSLEEMDSIFHKVKGTSGYFSVVKVARDEPRRYGKNGDLLIDYEKTEEHKGHMMHNEVGPVAGDETV
ncbi:general substrate transporter [Pseudomassariella vexata]|uniref:General substrate transporter n=1 Tax=Pseudomassariella vexata TaxID=1141098 RepID=A0A1Y2EHR3_9PEZI|nr:general substrate transporter [Pseudomassariella vexata]ORY71108.1 general substrate transporter [Pseudomassariella vexata]